MTGIYSIPQSFREGLTTLLRDKYQLISEWRGHIVQVWDSFIQEMKNRPNVAFTVFTVANLVFFTFMNNVAWSLERRVNDAPQKLSPCDRRFNYILIDGFLVGSSVLTFNLMLSQLTHHPLNKTTLAAITIGSIVVRYFLHLPVEEDNEAPQLKKDHTSPLDDKIDEPKSSPKNKKNEPIIQTPDKEKLDKAKSAEDVKKQEQAKFINEFCKELSLVLKTSFHYVDFTNEQKSAQFAFLEKMKKGVAVIEDEPDLCRAVNVPIQAAFEKLLCTMLISGDVKEAKALFLTGLPCTPLRTPQQDIDIEKTAEWKKWTVDIRTQTVRTLREEAKVIVSYSNHDYQALPGQSDKGKVEFDTYEAEKKLENIVDCPLDASIPKELIGAVYFFSDADDHHYILATQGIQIQNHGSAPKECWKMWLGAEESSEAYARLEEVLEFISQHTELSIFDEMGLEEFISGE
jgi:hypothetical protein